LRILFLAPQPFFEVRGTPLAVRAFVQELGALGHEVDLLTYPRGEAVAIPGVRHLRSLSLPVGRVPPGPSLAKGLLDLPFLAEAKLRMAFGRYALVHAVEEAALLLAPSARILGMPFVYDMDSSIPEQLRDAGVPGVVASVAAVFERHALRHAVAAVTVCPSLTATARKAAPDLRIFQIEDPPLGSPGGEDEAAARTLRASLGLEPGPIALYAGNFEPYQGVDLLVEATPAVPGVAFVFVGGEAPEVARLEERCRALGTASRCRFVGKRPPSEVPLFLALADVCVSPRVRGRNTPFKIYGYLDSGKPLVATAIESHTQVLDAEVAFLVDPTPEGLAAGIREAAQDRAAAARRVAAARALVQREYSQDRYRDKVRAAYRAIEDAL
jgi:glycosyltransferase involved in cell wall biosynthesis